MKNKNKEVPANKVLKPESKLTDVSVNIPVEETAKPKKKRYHKKQRQVVIDTPILDVVIEKEELTLIEPKLNWFQRQWNKFVLWYNA